MKTLITLFALLFITPAFASLTFEIKEMPADYLLFRVLSTGKTPGGKAGAAAKYTNELKVALSEMTEQAKKLKLTTGRMMVMIYDWETTGMTVALPVKGNVAAVPQGILKVRPAGKYVVGTQLGKKDAPGDLLKEGKKFTEANKQQFADTFYYNYIESGKPGNPVLYYARLK